MQEPPPPRRRAFSDPAPYTPLPEPPNRGKTPRLKRSKTLKSMQASVAQWPKEIQTLRETDLGGKRLKKRITRMVSHIQRLKGEEQEETQKGFLFSSLAKEVFSKLFLQPAMVTNTDYQVKDKMKVAELLGLIEANRGRLESILEEQGHLLRGDVIQAIQALIPLLDRLQQKADLYGLMVDLQGFDYPLLFRSIHTIQRQSASLPKQLTCVPGEQTIHAKINSLLQFPSRIMILLKEIERDEQLGSGGKEALGTIIGHLDQGLRLFDMMTPKS